ncbi:MAG: potassium channel family protein [Massiliimalia sp.]
MNILVVGCGKVGSKLASTLSREGHDVSVVDKNENSFELLDEDYSGFTTAGIPIDQDVLRRAGIENCDAVTAVSQDDNVNIMVSQLAREIFHIPIVLARIYDPKRKDVFSHFGLHTVCPTNLTVAAVKSAITEAHTPRNVNFGSHTVSFVTIDVPKNLAGTNANNLDFEEGQSLFAIIREDLSLELFHGQKIILKSTDKLIVSFVVD